MRITDAITLHEHDSHSPASFFLHGPAGTGKTFLYNALCSHYRAQGKIVICVASSGIAAQLLPGGHTAHSRFRIPLTINHLVTSNISRNSSLASLIQQTHLIIWDEVPMQHRYCFEAVSRTLNDICGTTSDIPFGSIPIVLGGDFAQILPVVRHVSRTTTIQTCLQHSPIWHHLEVLHLVQNLCIVNTPANQEFLTFVDSLAYNPHLYRKIQIPDMIHLERSIELLCEKVYPPELLLHATEYANAFTGRAILAFRNDTVNDFNNKMIDDMPGILHVFHAINTVDINEEVLEGEPLAAEVLQSIDLASVPPSCLKLKIGAPVIPLRNLSPTLKLCNSTCLCVLQIGRNCLKAAILGGTFDGEIRLLPRIKLSTSPEDLPFILLRKQFPIILCFAITVNKSQGQSFPHVDVDLRSEAFTHGQLYIALSRVICLSGLTLLLSENTLRETNNIVFPEVLL